MVEEEEAAAKKERKKRLKIDNERLREEKRENNIPSSWFAETDKRAGFEVSTWEALIISSRYIWSGRGSF